MAGSLKLGRQIRSIRGALTQQEFAKILNISQGSVAKYENGLALPKASTLCQIAKISGLTVENLLESAFPTFPSPADSPASAKTEASPAGPANESLDLIIAQRKIAAHEPEMAKAIMDLTKALAKTVSDSDRPDQKINILNALEKAIDSLG